MAGQKSQSRFYIQPKPGEVEFSLFGPVQKKDIRVGYIDPDRGYVTGITICEANAHAKLNPGSQFILNNRNSVRFLNINEVNNLTPDNAFDSVGVPGNASGVECQGVTVDNPPQAPTAEFYGGGGVGVKGNPVIGTDGSVLGVHLVERGFGYKYAPLVDIKDKFGTGAGVVAYAILAPEVNRGWEFYESKEDVEDYYPIQTADGTNIQTFCSDATSEVPYGFTYTVGGERSNEWDPTIYANLTEDLFRRRILEYQEYLDSLRSPWFATRYNGDMYAPSKISSDGGLELNPDYIFENRKNYNASTQGIYAVQHPGWGGYDLRNLESDIHNNGSGSTNKDIAEVQFEVFVHVLKDVVDGLSFKFTEVVNKNVPPEMGRYGPDSFTIKASEIDNTTGKKDPMWKSGSVKKITKKLKVDTLYEVQSFGSYKGKKTEQGLIKQLGENAEEIQSKAGKFIFADLVESANDNDDMQIGATVGEFTQENKWHTHDGETTNEPQSHLTVNDDGTWTETFKAKGHTTYDLFYSVSRREIEGTSGVTDSNLPRAADGAITQSFMNKYAISPVPMSNDLGSDYANQLFTMEWDLIFPYPGEYTFIGQSDNVCKFYLDGELIADLNSWKSVPLIIKKTLGWTIDEESGDNGKIHNIRLDLLNEPLLEDAVVQTADDGKVYLAADASNFQEVDFDGIASIGAEGVTGFGNIDALESANEVTFTSTSAAGCTNRFYVVERGAPGFTNEIEWINLSNRLNRNKTGITFVDDHGGDTNGWANITSGNARFSDDASRIEKIGSGSNTVTISYGYKDHGRNHADGFKINGVEWNNKVAGVDNYQDTITKNVDIVDADGGFKQVLVLERNATQRVTLKSNTDYGVYFTTTCNTDPMGAEITQNGSRIAIEDLGVSTPTDDMVVTASKGKFRSKDGTDDWGLFGHPNNGRLKDQVLWSMPQAEAGDGIIGGAEKMQFNFTAQDGTHSFSITAKEIKKARGIGNLSAKITKLLKINTLYNVVASSVVDGANRMEQGPSKTPGNTGFVDGDFHQAWESKQPIGSSHKTIHGSLIGAVPASFMQLTATQGDFKTTRKFRHPFIPKNVSDFTWAEKKKGEGLQTYEMTYEYKVERGKPQQATASTASSIKTKNVFDTATYQNDANRQLWRTNIYNRGGFLAKYGVCPFNVYEEMDNLELNDNPYAGDHTIIWNNINFPVSANYNIRVAVDDSVILDFEGPNGVTRLTKNGFWNGKSTGDSKYSQWFDKGSYKIKAILNQKEGGRFGFKKLTEEEKAERRQRIFDNIVGNRVPVPLPPPPPPPTTSEVTFTTTSEAGYTNSVSISEIGTLTRNASITKTVEIGKNYNVAFASSGGNHRVRLKLSPDKRKVFMEDLTAVDGYSREGILGGDFNDLVLTINGGKFKDIKDKRFLTYEGGMSDGSGAAVVAAPQPPEPLFPSSPDDIKIKGLNPMALSVEIKVSYAEATVVKQQSWHENPMGVAFNIRAPLAPPPQEEEPKSEGRCPNNPLWTTRFTSNSEKTWYPVYSKRSNDGDVDASNDWGDFMNQYAMSPVPPRSTKGTDEGGKWFSNTWKVAIPYKGWYTFKMCADDEAEFYIDGVEVMKSSNWKIPKEEMILIDKGMDEIAEFEIRVKNVSTTRMMRIDEKVFSARDWVKEGGATDEGFVAADRDPHQIRKVKFDVFSHVLRGLSGYGEIPPPPSDTVDVTFTSTHGADYTNRFFVVELDGDSNTNQIEWLNIHSRNFPLSNRLNRNKKQITFLDDHGGDINAWATITSGNAIFSDDANMIKKIGDGSNTVTIEYGWDDGGRNHGDGFIINGVEWNNKVAGYGNKGSMSKTVDISPTPGANQVVALTKAETKTVSLKTDTDYGVYFTSSGNSGNVTAEMTENGTVIGIDDLGKGGRKPRNNMVVTCSVGKYRSADGTDDWGIFGHLAQSSNNKQILWSVPKVDWGAGIRDNWNHDGLRFVFKEKGGKHQFEIRGDEVNNQSKDRTQWLTGDNSSVTKDVKLNTEYEVVATVNQHTSGGMTKTKCEQGLIKKIGRNVDEINFSENLMPSKRGSYIFADVEVSSDNDDLQVGCTEGFFTAFNRKQVKYSEEVKKEGNKIVKVEKATSTYDLKYKIEWEPPQTLAKNLTVTGTKKDGIVYKGPYLFSYLEKGWGSVMNRLSVACIMDKNQDLGDPNNNILGTKTLTWTNVPFKHEGQYDMVFMADDEAKFYINNELILNSKWGEFGDQHAKTRSFQIKTPGNYDIKVEVDNTSTHSNIFYDNPTGVVLEITKPLDIATYDVDGIINSESWKKNPMGVSMECVPPPCPKLETGIGQVGDVIITEPGNKYVAITTQDPGTPYDVVNNITGWVIKDKGINYQAGDQLEIDTPGVGIITTTLQLDPFGGISSITWPPPTFPGEGEEGTGIPTPPPGITTYPSFRITTPPTPPSTPPPPPPGTPLTYTLIPPPGIPDTGPPPEPPGTPPRTPSDPGSGTPGERNTGVNAKVVPIITPTVLLPDGIDPRTGMRIPSNQIIQVTDLVGLKQTGWYNGKEYYGAVFYKDGVRYAGYYQTAGVLIRVYSTKQESINAQITTPPSAILRQGTDVSSNDPRLNIPGTPQ